MKADKDFKYIRFDVGHHFHVCHRDTLLKCPESVLAKFISPEFDTRESESDYIIIDRDGKHFGAILNFLRDGRLNLSRKTEEELEELEAEASYYCMGELEKRCKDEINERHKGKKPDAEELEPSPYPFWTFAQAIEAIKASKQLGVVASSDYLDPDLGCDLRSKGYKLFYPIPLYFCIEKYFGRNNDLVLFNECGEPLLKHIPSGTEKLWKELEQFYAKIKVNCLGSLMNLNHISQN